MAKDGIRGKKAFFVLFAAILAAGALAPSVSFAITPERELQRLAIRQAAVKLKAWENQHWIDLLYYDKPLLGRYRSSAQDPRFFLAKWGAISPRLELEAAIDGFFYEGEPGNGPECRFPERYSWLREKFRLPVSALPQPRCAAFEEWKAGFAAETASLVFAPGDLKHSAAFHGDLFLRLKGPAGQERDAVIGCTAPAAGEGAFLSVLKAAAGAHSCSFSALPWSGARRAYAGLDDRDQWEFPLALDEEEKARLLNHLWELQNTSFSWRPFTRNSAWRLLKLLDAARPTSRGSARFHAWVLPLDAVRAAIPDAAGAAAVWRPALWKTVTWKREQLYIGEASSAYELVRGDQAAALKKLEETNAWHRAAILDRGGSRQSAGPPGESAFFRGGAGGFYRQPGKAGFPARRKRKPAGRRRPGRPEERPGVRVAGAHRRPGPAGQRRRLRPGLGAGDRDFPAEIRKPL